MDKALESLNEVMRNTAAVHQVPVYDLAILLPKSLDIFYDDVHFNVRGAAVVGSSLAKFLLASNQFR